MDLYLGVCKRLSNFAKRSVVGNHKYNWNEYKKLKYGGNYNNNFSGSGGRPWQRRNNNNGNNGVNGNRS